MIDNVDPKDTKQSLEKSIGIVQIHSVEVSLLILRNAEKDNLFTHKKIKRNWA